MHCLYYATPSSYDQLIYHSVSSLCVFALCVKPQIIRCMILQYKVVSIVIANDIHQHMHLMFMLKPKLNWHKFK